MTLASLFHPAVAAWFQRSFAAPTAAQAEAWPAIKSGRHVLIAAPTGSGKTLAAFLAAIDGLVRQGLEQGGLEDETQIVYVSPLKALSNDIQKNLEAPLAGIARGVARRRACRRSTSAPGCAPATRRSRAPEDGEEAAAHPRDDAGIAVPAARLRVRPQDAGDDARGDRRRNPRARREQARRASGAVARTARIAVRRQAAADRPVGDAEADRDGRPLPHRHRPERRLHDHRHRPSPRTRSRARNARRRRSKR